MCPLPDTAATASRSAVRPELLRALGAVVTSPPPYCQPVIDSLRLPAPTAAEHTQVFVLTAPPHAAIYLGQEGALGGEGLDRVAGFWRAIGLQPPQDADHLGLLLMLYAELSEAETGARSATTRDRVRHARQVFLFEHLWSWAPGYLTAITRLGTPSLAAWGRLTLAALGREAHRAAGPLTLPLALRTAPALPGRPQTRAQLLGALIAPARSGVLLTHQDLRNAAATAGLGYRVGERSFTLSAMLDQDAGATLSWLAHHARRWAARHAAQQPIGGRDPRHWWARRAARTARILKVLEASPVTSD